MNLLRRVRREILRHAGDCLALLFLAVWPFVYFWQASLRLAVFFFGDIFLFFYPTHLAYAEALRQGRLPLWEPGMFAGFPLYAEGQVGALYPLHLVLYRLLPIDIATNYDILIHMAWVMVGTYLLARTLKLSPPSACLAAFCFGMGGFFLPRLQHMSILAAASWLPWLMWAWERHELESDRRKRWRWFVLLALFSGIQLLGGHPQFAFSSALLLALYAVVRRPTVPGLGVEDQQRNKWAWLFRYLDFTRLIPLVLAFAIGAGLAAVQLLPTFELAEFTSRAGGLATRFFTAFSLRPIHFLMLLNPFLQGNPLPFVSVEVIGYVGLLTLIMAVAAPLVRRDRRVLFFVFVALFALFLGLGQVNPIYRALRYLPLFNYFRVPSRFLFWYTFAAAFLAAYTFEYIVERAPTTARLTRGQMTVGIVLAALIASIVGLVPSVPVEAWVAIWAWLPVLLAAVAAWILLGAARHLFTRTTLVTLVLGVAVLDLSLFAAVYAKTYDGVMPVPDFYQPPDTLSALQGLTPADGRVSTSYWIYPWLPVMRASLYPNISLAYGVANAVGYTPLAPQRTSDYLEQMNAPMLNLLNVRYYLIPQLLPVDPQTEGEDLQNPFMLDPVGRQLVFPPTPAVRVKIVSSLAQSTSWPAGEVVADIQLKLQDGTTLSLPLRAGIDTAEWAYERSDVRKALHYAMPPVASSFPASSAFPTEEHVGHTYAAEYDVTRGASPPVVVGLSVDPKVPAGLIHIERVDLVAPDGRDVSVAHLVGRDDQTLVYRTNLVAVYQNPDALPRALLVHDATVLDDTAALQEMRRDDFQPRAQLYLADGEGIQAGSIQLGGEDVRILDYAPEQVVLSVRASADAYLLLADAWYPGWVAKVDGVEAPIRRADLIFRAVRVGPGEHRVEFEYRPASLQIGLGISAAALVALVAIAAATRGRSRAPVTMRRP